MENLTKMTQFRNILTHQYQKTDLDIVKWVINKGFKDIVAFTQKIGIGL